jgi:putative toxin-antitoxin system antitoxin component (TIGR02293 family)
LHISLAQRRATCNPEVAVFYVGGLDRYRDEASAMKRTARLKTDESDRIAHVAALAIEALGRNEGLQWLREPNSALGKRSTLEMLGTEAGANQVVQIIGRIEHGVIS